MIIINSNLLTIIKSVNDLSKLLIENNSTLLDYYIIIKLQLKFLRNFRHWKEKNVVFLDMEEYVEYIVIEVKLVT